MTSSIGMTSSAAGAAVAAGAQLETPGAVAAVVGPLLEGLSSSESGTRPLALGLLEAVVRQRGTSLYDVVMELPALQQQLGALCIEGRDVPGACKLNQQSRLIVGLEASIRVRPVWRRRTAVCCLCRVCNSLLRQVLLRPCRHRF